MGNKPESCVIKFSVTGVPDTTGLRIRLTDRMGIYLSSIDPLAAQDRFEMLVIEFAIERELLVTKGVLGFKLKKEPDWNSIVISGQGETEVVPVNLSDTESLKEAVPVKYIVKSPEMEIEVEWFESPFGEKFCIAHDKGENIDSWLLDEVLKDLEEASLQ